MICNHQLITKQRGVALIQVLLISAIITILAIRFSYTAREQVETANLFEQRIKATQLLKSAQSKVIYRLLTEDDFTRPSEILPNSERWNFYGKPFSINENVQVVMQDNNGLLSQHNMDDPLWDNLLQRIGFNEQQAGQFKTQITEWQDETIASNAFSSMQPKTLNNGLPYRNQPIQLPQEINWFFEEYPERLQIIKQVSSHYLRKSFNPLNAPDALITALFDPSVAQQVIEQRNQGEITEREVINFLGRDYDDEATVFFNSLALRMTIQVNYAEVVMQETLELKIQAHRQPQVSIFARY